MEQSSINVFERISAEYYNLTTAEKKAADYVLSHQRKAQDMSITELAAASGVAEATVSRFCRRLGCKGYNAFRLAIANSIAQRPQQARQEIIHRRRQQSGKYDQKIVPHRRLQ